MMDYNMPPGVRAWNIPGNKEEGIMWIYLRSEPGLWTVGFYNPEGKFQTDSDHEIREEAAKRCHYLNGGGTTD